MKKIFLGILLCLCFVFAFNEDDTINEALDAVDAKEYAKARDLYLVLYDESGKMEYLKEGILVSSLLNDPNGTINLVQLFQKKSKDEDLEIEKVLADSYLKIGDLNNSIRIIEKIKTKEDTPLVQEILGSLYVQSKRYDDALKELNKAYNETHSEASLEKIIAIYLDTQKTNLVGDLLNSHLEQYGCSQELCKKSIEFYVQTKQISRVEKLLKQIEERSPTIQNATNLIAVYAYEKKFDEALEVAKKYPLNRSILLELYVGKKDFKSASKQAELIYQEGKNPEFLILAQIYEFEALKDNATKQEIIAMIANLKKGIGELKKEKEKKNAFLAEYLNFLGYLMVDYEIDIKEGMIYIKEALELDSKNFEFIDSLAWAYYKLGECQKAREEFSKIPKEKIEQVDELKKHNQLISSCFSK